MLIQDIRKEIGVSRLKFARLLRVSESSLVRWEKGVTTPDGLPMIVINALDKILTDEVSKSEAVLRAGRLREIVVYAEIDVGRSLLELFAVVYKNDLKKRFYKEAS
jgi:transcriptional regulator with XRE-family HTH domain